MAPDMARPSRSRPRIRQSCGRSRSARSGDVADRLRRPGARVGVQGNRARLRRRVRLQVRQVHVVVAAREQQVTDGREDAWLVPGEVTVEDQVERRARLRFVFVVPERVVPAAALDDLLRRQPEEKEVVLAGLARHLDRGAVARADGERAVHHELHVAGTAGLEAGGRDLFRHVGGRDQALGQAHVVIGEKQDTQTASHRRLALDRRAHVVDQFDDELGKVVRWRRLPGKEERARRDVDMRIGA